MKYYIGRLRVLAQAHEYESDACIAAGSESEARELLRQRALLFIDGHATADSDGTVRFSGDEDLAVKPLAMFEIDVATFECMRRMLPTLGRATRPDLGQDALPEQAKTLARRLRAHLQKAGVRVSHSKMLHAVAASIGKTDWQVLFHQQKPSAQSAQRPCDDQPAQPCIPGNGPLWLVPVTVDATMTAQVLVRANDKDSASLLARQFAAQGHARFEVDDGNCRSMDDYYVADPDSVVLQDDASATRSRTPDSERTCRRGAYLVELCDLGDGEDSLLWADLSVFEAGEVEPVTHSCMSCLPVSSTPHETRALCVRVAELLERAAPCPTPLDGADIRDAFVRAVQGEQTQPDFDDIEAVLRQAVNSRRRESA